MFQLFLLEIESSASATSEGIHPRDELVDENNEIDSDSSDDNESPNEFHSLPAAEPEPRYPRQNRRPTRSWFMASPAQCSDPLDVTTSDDPTVREAMSAPPEERDVWQSAIDDEFASLESKNTWKSDVTPDAQPLPTHIVLKIKRDSDGVVERFKARIVAMLSKSFSRL